MSANRHWEQDKDSTLYVGNLDERATDSLVWELMLQAGPIINVHLPKDRVTQTHQGYGFVEFASEEDADYAAKIMNQIRLWGKPIRVNKASADKRGPDGTGSGQGVGAELFVGNLDGLVDEKTLWDTFSRFGPLMAPPKIARDDSNLSKGYGFISYSTFEASDDAIVNMHGQFLMNKEITVQYAYKKDGKGERHGDEAERALAAQAKMHGVQVNIPAMPASLVMPSGAPSAPASMQTGQPNGYAARPPQAPPGAFGGYNAYPPPTPAGYGNPSPVGGYNAFPPPGQYQHAPAQVPPQQLPIMPYQQVHTPIQHAMPHAPPPRNYSAPSPLQPPPGGAGLPARPPPSMAGYGGPAMSGMQAPAGFPGAPPGLPPTPVGFRPPNGFGGPPQQQR
nr:splicing factor 3b subunit 4 [Quercus suber]